MGNAKSVAPKKMFRQINFPARKDQDAEKGNIVDMKESVRVVNHIKN